MHSTRSSLSPLSYAAVAALLASSLLGPVTAQEKPVPTVALLPNGDFQADANRDSVPDGWPSAKGGLSYSTEEGNRFLHLSAEKPDEMVMAYRQIAIPKDVRALELSWRQRTNDLKVGSSAWFDARILMQWKNAAGEKLTVSPPTPATNRNSAGWIEKTEKFLVPEGAVTLDFMPTLFRVKSGTFDLDDIVLKPTDPEPVAAAAKAKADERAQKLEQAVAKKQQNAASKAGPDGELIANGDFQAVSTKDPHVPDKWGALKDDLSWQEEEGNRFLRLVSPEPGKMVMLYRAIDLPKGVQALELKWKERVSNFQRGKENYFDARIMANFMDGAGKKMEGAPSLPSTSKNTDGWVEKSKSFIVPPGAVTLVLMPSLFQVKSGTFDLDNLSLKPTDPAALLAAAKEKAAADKAAMVDPEKPNQANWPKELHVQGTKFVTADGKEIVLRGVNVDSLEWSVRGEQVMKSALVALDEWKSNVLRLPVTETFWFGRDSSQKDGGKAYRELVDNIIVLAANRHAYVMLDLHRFRAPKQAHVEFWKDAATRYKNHPEVIFELFNEPHGTSWEVWRNGGFVEDKKAPAEEDTFLTPEEKALNTKGFHAVGMQALVDAVRSTGAKNVVVTGGLDWAYDLSGVTKGFALDQKDGNGLAYATHIYPQKTDWKGKVLVTAEKYPIVVSELGANTKKLSFMPAESQEDAATWVPRILGFIQQHQFSWTAFSLHPKSAPQLILDWKYTPTPEWGALAKKALAGEKFPAPDKLR